MSDSQKSENLHVNSRMLVILMLLVGLVNVIGVIISGVAMTHSVKPNVAISQSNPTVSAKFLMDAMNGGLLNGDGSNSLSGTSVGKRSLSSSMNRVSSTGQRIWTFAIGHEYGAMEYADTAGYLQGFNKMMIAKVCDAMGIHCEVVYDRYQNCWTSEPGQHPHGGQGLFGDWYDACVGWVRTPERDHVFKFSQAYQHRVTSHFYVQTYSALDVMNITGKMLGFMEGSASSEKCLAHNIKEGASGYPVQPEKIVYATDPYSLVQLLKQKRVSAILSTPDIMARYENTGEIRQIRNIGYECAKDGLAIMTRKDSTLSELWNQGYAKIRQSGVYKTICDDAKQSHGAYGDINCID